MSVNTQIAYTCTYVYEINDIYISCNQYFQSTLHKSKKKKKKVYFEDPVMTMKFNSQMMPRIFFSALIKLTCFVLGDPCANQILFKEFEDCLRFS